MSLRSAPLVLAAACIVGLVGCSRLPAAPVASAPSAGPAVPARSAEPPLAVPSLVAVPTATADTGNVEAPVTPSLSVERVGAVAIRVTLADPAAKAWRVTVSSSGLGSAAGRTASDSWTLTVETGDVAPIITTTDTQDGVAGEPQEQPGLEAGTAPGRVCSLAVPVCVRAASLDLPHDGNGTLVLEIGRTDTHTALGVTGATASWPREPFMLGPWTTTGAFAWPG